jgi:hypothetical protein
MTRRVCCIVVAALLVPCAVVAQTAVDEAVPPGNNTIRGLFAVNRRAGALWALAEEPNAAHIVGRSRDFSLMFFEDVLSLRVTPEGALRDSSATPAALGNYASKSADAPGDKPPAEPTAWLATERIARAWTALVNDRPFD